MDTLSKTFFDMVALVTYSESAAAVVGSGHGSGAQSILTWTTTSCEDGADEDAGGDISGGDGIDPSEMYRHSPSLTAFFCIAYAFVFLIGSVGNLLVFSVILRSTRMHNVTNFFIANLAVADLLVIFFCLPATLLSNIYVAWVLGSIMCSIVPVVQGISVAASVYSMVAVSVDRCLAICYPLKCQITTRRARYIIGVIWLVAIFITTPWVLVFKMVKIEDEEPRVDVCQEVWPDWVNENLYFLLGNLGLCFVLPMVVTTVCYVMIWRKVSQRTIPTDNKDEQVERIRQKSKVKVTKMLVIVVLAFLALWSPLYIIFAFIKLGGPLPPLMEDYLPVIAPIAQWLGATHSCINPIVYAFCNKKFRRGFMAVVRSGTCWGKVRYNDNIVASTTAAGSRSASKASYYITNHHAYTKRQTSQETNVSYILDV